MADNIEEVVYDILTGDAAFMANFSGVYTQEAPKAAVPPYIVFWLVDDTGVGTNLNTCSQGEARIQFDLWATPTTSGKNKGRKLRTTLRNKVNGISEISGGYYIRADGVTEQTILRASGTDLFHYVVDGVFKWNKQ